MKRYNKAEMFSSQFFVLFLVIFIVIIINPEITSGRKDFTMKFNEFAKQEVKKNMPMGRHNVTFEGIDYRIDADGNVTGAFVRTKEYRNLFLPIFEEQNTQLDLLCDQLGVDTYDPIEINKAKGTIIIATRYEREQYVNVSFNPADRNEDSELENIA